jgi:hypothetical protein
MFPPKTTIKTDNESTLLLDQDDKTDRCTCIIL